MIPEICPRCGAAIQVRDKDASSGRDIVTYGCDACRWSADHDGGTATSRVVSDVHEDASESKPPRRPEGNSGTPQDAAGQDGPPDDLSSQADEPTAARSGDDQRDSIGQENRSAEEMQAHLDGYNDCFSYRHIPFGYKPTAGYEEAYKAGWNERMQEEDEQMIREWTGLP